jgi:nucleoside-diphosphate-sugar epimerase
MGLFVIIGAGPVGSGTALRLADAGHHVTVVTRSGSGPGHTLVECVAADASDETHIAKLADRASAIVNCANPPYTHWDRDWPPMAAALLAAAGRTGAGLVTVSNLYGHGPAHHTMRADTPLESIGKKGRIRADMWRQAKVAHDAGRVLAAEVRASDFYGPGVTDASMGSRVVPRVLAGQAVRLMGSLDVPHSFSYMPDVTATVAAVASSAMGWGRPWLVPSITMTQGEMVRAMCAAAGVDPVKASVFPQWMMATLGTFIPLMRELREVQYQFTSPFIVDAAETTAAFDIHASDVDLAIAQTIAWWQTQGLNAG